MTENDQYVYCLVDTSDDCDLSINDTGMNGEPVEVVDVGGVGIVTHTTDGLYDSDNLDQIQQWLLDHQSVVDSAGETFGTPLPLQFDTVFEGGMAAVEDWVSTHHQEINEHLNSFAGHWEYRVHLLWDDEAFESTVTEEDGELKDLARRKEEATAGKSYMIEKQYEQRLRERRQERKSELVKTLINAVEPVAVDYFEMDDSGSLIMESRKEERNRVTRLGVLTHTDDERALGERLDDVAAIDGVTIRFTGPWPPYGFTPEFE